MWTTFLACATPGRPDVVLVVVDTLRADVLSTYGASVSAAPNLDAWAGDARVFDRAYSHSGWTLPAFASLFSGLYPHEHRAVRNAEDSTAFGHLDDDVDTLAEQFWGAGYATAGFHNNTFLAPEFGLHQGFVTYVYVAPRGSPETVDEALAWLGSQTSPVFLLVHFMDPHHPYEPPESARIRFTGEVDEPPGVPRHRGETQGWKTGRDTPSPEVQEWMHHLYRGEVYAADVQVGRLLDGLGRRARPTLVAVTADHGEEFWDHGGFEHGHTLFSELTHVPLMLRGPGWTAGRTDDVVSHVDLHATLLAAAGVAAGAATHGRTLGSIGPEASVIQDNCLYGGQKTSVVTATHRLVVDQISRARTVWEVGPDTREGKRLDSAPTVRDPLLELLTTRRGGLDPIESNGAARASRRPLAQRLEALGYLEP